MSRDLKHGTLEARATELSAPSSPNSTAHGPALGLNPRVEFRRLVRLPCKVATHSRLVSSQACSVASAIATRFVARRVPPAISGILPRDATPPRAVWLSLMRQNRLDSTLGATAPDQPPDPNDGAPVLDSTSNLSYADSSGHRHPVAYECERRPQSWSGSSPRHPSAAGLLVTNTKHALWPKIFNFDSCSTVNNSRITERSKSIWNSKKCVIANGCMLDCIYVARWKNRRIRLLIQTKFPFLN